jgi:hypothetical protein
MKRMLAVHGRRSKNCSAWNATPDSRREDIMSYFEFVLHGSDIPGQDMRYQGNLSWEIKDMNQNAPPKSGIERGESSPTCNTGRSRLAQKLHEATDSIIRSISIGSPCDLPKPAPEPARSPGMNLGNRLDR